MRFAVAERSATGGRLGSRQKKSPRVKRGSVESSEEPRPRRGSRQSLSVRSVRATAKAIIQADRGVDAGKFVVKAELPASCCRSGRKAREATRRAYVMVSETNEHVLGFDTPVAGKGPFNTATERRSCDGLSVYSRAGYEHERYSTSRDRLRDNDRYLRALSVTATR